MQRQFKKPNNLSTIEDTICDIPINFAAAQYLTEGKKNDESILVG